MSRSSVIGGMSVSAAPFIDGKRVSLNRTFGDLRPLIAVISRISALARPTKLMPRPASER